MLAFHGAMFTPPPKTSSKSYQSFAVLLAVACLPWLLVAGCSTDGTREASPKNGQTSTASVAEPSGTIGLMHQPGSKRRAGAVKQALLPRYHMAPDRLSTDGFDASRPVDTKDTLEGRPRNRRVELTCD